MFRVNLANGGLCLTVSGTTIPGPFPISLRRSYASSSQKIGLLGSGWTFLSSVRLHRHGANLEFVVDGDRRCLFVAEAAEPQGGEAFRLSRNGTGEWLVTDVGERIEYVFSANLVRGVPIRKVDRYGNYQEFRHDDRGQLIQIDDSMGRVLRFSYVGPLIRDISMDTRDSRSSSQTLLECIYDRHDNLVESIDWPGTRCQFEYDQHRMIRFMNACGGEFCASYDDQGWCVATWARTSQEGQRLYYDKQRHQTIVRDSLGHDYLLRFDEQQRLIESTDPIGAKRQTIRDPQGNAIAKVLPDGSVIGAWHLSSDGQEIHESNPLGGETKLILSSSGAVSRVTDVLGKLWSYEHNKYDDVVVATTPTGHSWKFGYSSRGEGIVQQNPDGDHFEMEISPDGRRVIRTDESGAKSKLEYDAFGRLTAETKSGDSGLVVTYHGNRHEVRRSDGTEIVHQFNELSRLTAYTNEIGQTWTYRYSPYGRLTESSDPASRSIRYEYDSEGRPIAVYNEIGDRFESSYDAAGRIVWQRTFADQPRMYQYDESGRLIGNIDGNGIRSAMETDLLNNPVIVEFSTGERVENTYDPAGRRVAIVTPESSLQLTYDPDGRLSKEVSDDSSVEYTYGWREAPTQIRSAGRTIEFKYGRLGELVHCSDRDLQVTCSFDAASRTRTIWFNNTISVQRIYDQRDRLTAQRAVRANGELSFEEQFGYDGTGNLVHRQRSGRDRFNFLHGTCSELVECRSSGSVLRRYQYDLTGNVTEPSRAQQRYQKGNRLTEAFGAEYEYDGEGRPVRATSDQGGVEYQYDYWGRLRSLSHSDGGSWDYVYDPLFRRTQWSSPHGDGKSCWALDWLLSDKLEDGTLVEYLFHPVEDYPLAVRIDGVWYVVIVDGRGEATDLFRLDDVKHVWSAEPLGFESLVLWDHLDGRWRVRGLGQIADPDTGLIYQRARYYQPSLARFLTPDPIGIYGGWNAYRYCLNQPLQWVDPLGLCPSLDEAKCSELRGDVERQAKHVEKRWNEMQKPKEILPWTTPPALPKGQIYPAAVRRANGEYIPAGSESKGSLGTHLDAYEQEQKGLKNTMQEYHAGGCAEYETAAQRAQMRQFGKWQSKKPEIPGYPKQFAPKSFQIRFV